MHLCRKRIRAYVWIASIDTQGKKFYSGNSHEKEENELVHIVKEISEDNIHFHCMYLNEKIGKVFIEMRYVYESAGRAMLVLRSFEDDFIPELVKTSTRESIISFNIFYITFHRLDIDFSRKLISELGT